MKARLLSLLICLSPLPALADASSAVGPLRHADARQVQEIMPASTSDAAQLRRGSEVMAVLYTKALDDKDPDWTARNPHWNDVLNTVHADIYNEVAAVLASEGPKFNKSFADAVSRNLSQKDLTTVLNYYRSDEGQRYRTFVNTIDGLVADSMTTLQRLTIAGLATPDDAVPAVSAETYAARKRLLELSEGFRIVQAKPGEEHNNDAEVLGVFLKMTMRFHGSDLDQLNEKYAQDLPRFEAFSRSPAAASAFSALASATDQMLPNISTLQKKLDDGARKHADDWVKYYQEQTGKASTISAKP